MTIDLLPGRGLRLPAPLPELPFGLTEAEVRRLLAPHDDVLGGILAPAFVCRSTWALGFTLPGLSVDLSGWDDGTFAFVSVSRHPSPDESPCPVGVYGVDVFGWPAEEVVAALRAEGLDVPDLSGRNLRFGPLHLSVRTVARPAGAIASHRTAAQGRRKPRHEPPFTFDFVSLSAENTDSP
ncbi:hypothetical protein KV557_18780 [Kitasatospora aureofaciens]|uniref:hypothetical protein n=1 Tax=Kitasatospora aureofaciens TaxID=1894 RepID=UPI001C437166|nr:hypothetical protein [Kitasatospora aureofaciens]MBV6699139.1 hypothetical protein [Kitasatospora aureofaciens]